MGEFNPPADVLDAATGDRVKGLCWASKRADCVLKARQLVGTLGTGLV